MIPQAISLSYAPQWTNQSQPFNEGIQIFRNIQLTNGRSYPQFNQAQPSNFCARSAYSQIDNEPCSFRIPWDSVNQSSSCNKITVQQADCKPRQGAFTVGSSGKVSANLLGSYAGYNAQVGVFSLTGMENLKPGSAEFNKEAARRILSNSTQGHIAVSNSHSGAKYTGNLGEGSSSQGAYADGPSLDMTPGDKIAVMMVPNGTIQQVLDNPSIDGDKKPLYSINEANPTGGTNFVELPSNKNIFSFEDIRLDGNSDKDYNDVIFQLKGVENSNISAAPDLGWTKTSQYQDLVSNA
jgi:hypothetical protein